MKLQDNFMKFTKKIQKDVKRQEQKEFSPGGTHRGYFYIIEQNLIFRLPEKGPISGKLQNMT